MSDDVVVVIGAGGIGLAIARRQGAGKSILLADFNPDTLQSAANELTGLGHRVTPQEVDVSSRDSVRSLAQQAAQLGHVTQLVQAAGLSPAMAPPAAVLKVDLYGTALVFEEFGEVIAAGGSAIVISSMAGYRQPPLPPEQEQALATVPADELLQLAFLTPEHIPNSVRAYEFSKRANRLRMQGTAVEWKEKGARANSISPGVVMTPLAQTELNSARGPAFRQILDSSPAGRAGIVDEVASLAAFLLGPEAGFITGSDFLMEGGVTAVQVVGGAQSAVQVSEEIVGQAIQDRRDDVFLATKFFMPMGDDPNSSGGSRRWIIRAVENSLRRLNTDHIDLYQVHRPSPDTDVEETLGALTDLVRQGKVRYLGSSSYSGSQIVEAQSAARDRHLERFVTEQPPYSILVRGIEEDILPTVQRHGMGTLTYSPLGGGWLSGRWRKNAAAAPTSSARPNARFDMDAPANQRKLDIVEELAQLAEQAGMTLIELAIAFVINHPGVTSAIVGPRTMEQLESYLPAAEITLSTDVLDRIDQLATPGVTINPDDNSYGTNELTPAARRR